MVHFSKAKIVMTVLALGNIASIAYIVNSRKPAGIHSQPLEASSTAIVSEVAHPSQMIQQAAPIQNREPTAVVGHAKPVAAGEINSQSPEVNPEFLNFQAVILQEVMGHLGEIDLNRLSKKGVHLKKTPDQDESQFSSKQSYEDFQREAEKTREAFKYFGKASSGYTSVSNH